MTKTTHYIDVHTHLTDSRFDADRHEVIQRAIDAGVGAMVVNGLEPQSNRQILAMAAQYPQIRPALGIYPIDAVHELLAEDFPHRVQAFDVRAELAFIREQALSGRLTAIGECGLDAYWLTEDTFAAQERVFVELIGIALEADLPIIIHTRKLEERSMQILRHHGAKRVDFHCFGGKVKLAQQGAEKDGWWFSIPANARVNEGFRKMLSTLPSERILTETDAPYLAPERGTRNEPRNVVGTVAFFAELRGVTMEAAKEQIWRNYTELFGPGAFSPQI